MSEPSQDGRSLLQLAISLRLAAQRLAKSANRMQQAAEGQREQLDRLTLLRDRIIELLAVCRRIADKRGAAAPPAPAVPPKPARPTLAGPPRTQLPKPRLPASAFVEFSNWQEFEKFRRMPPIGESEIAGCDIDELIRRLNDEAGPHRRKL
jgi:hypothetical protein